MKSRRANRKFSFPITTLLGSSVSNFIKACKGYHVEPKYYIRIVLSFIIASIFEILAAYEKLVWNRRLKRYSIDQPPVFIIGFWRSGTTLLHNLMCQAPQAAYVTTFQTVFPNQVLSQKWVKSITNLFLPEKRPFDDYLWSMDSPQEEEFALSNMQPYSFYKFFLFPSDFNRIMNDELPFEKLSEQDKAEFKEAYVELVKKAMLNTKGSLYIGKNPCNIHRVATLQEMFPDAKFIFIYRNPYKVVESLYGFSHSIIAGIQVQESRGLPDRDCIARLYQKSFEEYFRVKPFINPDNLMEFSYEEMLTDIPGKIAEIYQKFDIPGIEESLTNIQAYLNKIGVEKRQPLDIPEETCTALNKHAAPIIEKLGYSTVNR